MTYLYMYFGAGFLLLMIFYIESKFTKKAQENKALYELLKPKSQSVGQKIVNSILIPVIALIIAFLFWPAVIIWLIREKYNDYKYEHKEKKEEEPFSVKKDDLIKELKISEIEKMEMIYDPLNAVPNLPFGHLHNVWNEFREKVESEDKIWSFTGQWSSEWGRKYEYHGYSILRNNEPIDYIITASKTLES